MTSRRLGKYEIIERIGRGGMAEVYRAYHASLDRYVAIKVLHKFLAEDSEFKTRFEREAQNIARLKHPNIVQVYDFEFDPVDGSYYMVMELVDGPTLKDRLHEMERQGEPFPLLEALRITREAASALSYAHRVGMIHRDVKPANLMLAQNEHDQVVLTDFGIARLLSATQFTVTGGLVGTPAYMAPEQGVGETGDERSDLYSLGVILFQMVTGELPYDADTPLALILKHVNEAIPSACMVNPTLPTRVDDLIEKLMAKNADDRYQTAADLITDIERLEADIKSGDVVPVSSPPPMVVPITPIVRAPSTTPRGEVDRPTVRLIDTARMQVPQKMTTGRTLVLPVKPEPPRRSGLGWLVGLILMILIVGGGYMLGASNGIFPALAFLASQAPGLTATPTETMTPTAEATSVVMVDLTDEPSAAPIITASPTATATDSATFTATITERPDPTASRTRRPTSTANPTLTEVMLPSPSPNMTETTAAQQTATTEACLYDYSIVSQIPEDGEDGGFFTVNSEYSRSILLLNSGTCAWEGFFLLSFVEGESFSAGPRIVVQGTVEVGQQVELIFEGDLPNQGRIENGQVVPVDGRWQLLTRGRIPIGDPLLISVLVYDPGG